MMLLQIPGTLIHIGKPTSVINDHAHLPVLLLGKQFKTASTQLPEPWGVFRTVFDT